MLNIIAVLVLFPAGILFIARGPTIAEKYHLSGWGPRTPEQQYEDSRWVGLVWVLMAIMIAIGRPL